MEKGKKLYEGKAKIIYATTDDNIYWLAYKDSVTAFNGEKQDEITGKGQLNNEISSLMFEKLHDMGIQSHFINKISPTEQLVKKVSIIPVEVVVRNIAAGSMSKRLGLEEGMQLNEPVTDFHYKNDILGDPLVTQNHIILLNIASIEQIEKMKEIALIVNKALIQIFYQVGITLVDFKLEFGLDTCEDIILADEISPDTCRLWDVKSDKKLDKDIYRKNLGDLISGYQQVLDRLRSTGHV